MVPFAIDALCQVQTLRIQQLLRQPYQRVHVQVAPRPEPARKRRNAGRRPLFGFQRPDCGRASVSRYKRGCRCVACRRLKALYMQQYRLGQPEQEAC